MQFIERDFDGRAQLSGGCLLWICGRWGMLWDECVGGGSL